MEPCVHDGAWKCLVSDHSLCALFHYAGLSSLAHPFVSSAATMKSASAGAKEITWPFLCIQGDADKLVHAPGATEFYNAAASTDKKMRIWQGGYHELFNDLPSVSEAAMREVTEWIVQRA